MNSKIRINKGVARWCHTPNSKANADKKLMDTDLVNKSITFLLDNCFFTVGKHIFQQVIGIPMGTDPAPFMANLFLYYYENKFMKELEVSRLIAVTINRRLVGVLGVRLIATGLVGTNRD